MADCTACLRLIEESPRPSGTMMSCRKLGTAIQKQCRTAARGRVRKYPRSLRENERYTVCTSWTDGYYRRDLVGQVLHKIPGSTWQQKAQQRSAAPPAKEARMSKSCPGTSLLLLLLGDLREGRHGRTNRHGGHGGGGLDAIHFARCLFRLDVPLRFPRRQHDANRNDCKDGEVSTEVDGAPDGHAVGQPQHLEPGGARRRRSTAMLGCEDSRTSRASVQQHWHRPPKTATAGSNGRLVRHVARTGA